MYRVCTQCSMVSSSLFDVLCVCACVYLITVSPPPARDSLSQKHVESLSYWLSHCIHIFVVSIITTVNDVNSSYQVCWEILLLLLLKTNVIFYKITLSITPTSFYIVSFSSSDPLISSCLNFLLYTTPQLSISPLSRSRNRLSCPY